MTQLGRGIERARYRLGRIFLRRSHLSTSNLSTFTVSLPDQQLLMAISEFETQFQIIRRLWAVPSMRRPRYWNRRRLWEQVDELGDIIDRLDDHRRGIEGMIQLLSQTMLGPALQESSFEKRKANASAPRKVPGAYPMSSSGRSAKSSFLGVSQDPCPTPSRATVSNLLSGYLDMLKQTRDDVDSWRRLLREIADGV